MNTKPFFDDWRRVTTCGTSGKTPHRRGGGISANEAAIRLMLKSMDARIAILEARAKAVTIPIASLEPHPFRVLSPIPAVVQQEDDVFVATFFDANISGSGESQLDAVEMLKERIAITFRGFTKKMDILGAEPRRQLNVLRRFVDVAS